MWKNKTESLDRKTRNACNNLFGDNSDASSTVFEIKTSVHTPTPRVRASSPIDTFFVSSVSFFRAFQTETFFLETKFQPCL